MPFDLLKLKNSVVFFSDLTAPVFYHYKKWLQLDVYIPGRNPGTSTKVIIGMLKASRNLTKRAAFTEASISRQPEKKIKRIENIGGKTKLHDSKLSGLNSYRNFQC